MGVCTLLEHLIGLGPIAISGASPVTKEALGGRPGRALACSKIKTRQLVKPLITAEAMLAGKPYMYWFIRSTDPASTSLHLSVRTMVSLAKCSSCLRFPQTECSFIPCGYRQFESAHKSSTYKQAWKRVRYEHFELIPTSITPLRVRSFAHAVCGYP